MEIGTLGENSDQYEFSLDLIPKFNIAFKRSFVVHLSFVGIFMINLKFNYNIHFL